MGRRCQGGVRGGRPRARARQWEGREGGRGKGASQSERAREVYIVKGNLDQREGAARTKLRKNRKRVQLRLKQTPEGKGEADGDTCRDQGAVPAAAVAGAPALAWASSDAAANSVAMMLIMATDKCIRSGRAVSTASVAVASLCEGMAHNEISTWCASRKALPHAKTGKEKQHAPKTHGHSSAESQMQQFPAPPNGCHAPAPAAPPRSPPAAPP